MEFSNIKLRHGKSVAQSRADCDTSSNLGKRKFAMPVMAANMKSIITPEICKIFDRNNLFYVYHRIDGTDDVYKFVEYANKELSNTSISIGITTDWIDLISKLKDNNLNVDYFTVDVALSYNDNIVPIIKHVKNLYPESFLIVGNGSTSDWIKWIGSYELVDAVKVGIGVSKSCMTTPYTGFGSTTVDSLIECSNANKSLDKPMIIISDGGLTTDGPFVYFGDITKALIFGADWVMSGAIYSRCIDSPSIINGYYGNASEKAGKSNRIEGRSIEIESNGRTIEEQIQLCLESLQSSISYSGGLDIWEMKQLTRYDIVS